MREAHTAPPNDTAREAVRINLSWLVRLRWGAVLGQVATILIANVFLGVALPLVALGGVIAVEAGFNILVARPLANLSAPDNRHIAVGLVFDIVVLTVLLALSGGPNNPFSFLYLVYIALGAIVLPPPRIWTLVFLSTLGSALLFILPGGGLGGPHAHHGMFTLHLQGMWIALAVAATFIVYFVMRIRSALATREVEIDRMRSEAERSERLSSLATLAAGTAHELSTPLATIAMVARELARRLETEKAHPDLVSDAVLVRSEVERCRQILERMAGHAGAFTADSEAGAPIEAVVNEVLGNLASADRDRVRVNLAQTERRAVISAPFGPLVQALKNLVRNALDEAASQEGDRALVDLDVARHRDDLIISVRDRGQGMSDDVLARAAEPFFTTKPAGRGMGLGLFVARGVVEQVGGRLELQSAVDDGTTARMVVPVQPADHKSSDGAAA